MLARIAKRNCLQRWKELADQICNAACSDHAISKKNLTLRAWGLRGATRAFSGDRSCLLISKGLAFPCAIVKTHFSYTIGGRSCPRCWPCICLLCF